MNNINRAELTRKIESDEPVDINFKYADSRFLVYMNSLMAKYLARMDRLFLLNSVITILREVIVNAQKANAKRVFFIKNNLDIHNPDDYQTGMDRFKSEVIGDFEQVENDIKNSDFFVNVNFNKTGKNLRLQITNNSAILPEEMERINIRISRAIKYNDFTEAYEEIMDDTEGAGLGIVLTILFFKSMGIDPSVFKINTDGEKTVTEFSIPEKLRSSLIITSVKKGILGEIEGIPTFPENVLALLTLVDDPDSSINEISNKIMLDPALSIDVIKLSNSAGFVTGKRIESVNQAVMTIGLENVKGILMTSNARTIMNKRYSSYENIWEHCNKTAFYARQIALIKHISGVLESAFIAGMLHDLGKIILLATDMELVKKIANAVKDKEIVTSTIMEEISIGISHSEIGSLIAENWNFPPFLVEAIKYHHSPLSASPEYRNLVNVVYLANMFCGIEDRKYDYYYLDEGILNDFGIIDEEKFRDFHDSLKEKFKNRML